MRAILVLMLLFGGGIFAASQFFTVFSIPPMGAAPEGATVLMWRSGRMEAVDSADAICKRTQGNVTLLCRASALGGLKPENVIVRMPYQRDIYLLSTGGDDYSEQSEFPGLIGPISPRR